MNGTVALFGAFSLFLSAIDYLLPKPLPFMRLGLANLPLLLALYIPPGGCPRKGGFFLFSLKEYCLLVLIKTLGQAIISGTLLSYAAVFSLAGSAASSALMYALRRVSNAKLLSLAGTGIAGAFASNGAQLVLARFFVFGESAAYLAPPFLAAGIVSGAALGIFAERFTVQSRWLRGVAGQTPVEACPAEGGAPETADLRPGGRMARNPRLSPSLFKLCLILAAAALFLFTRQLALKAALFAVFVCAAVIAGKKPRPLLTLAVMAGITVCGLFPPYGKVLFQAGPLMVAQGSLEGGIGEALNLEGLFMLSKLFVSSGFTLPGPFGRLLSESFRILEQLNNRKNRLAEGRPPQKRLMERLDALLLELDGQR